MSCYRCPRGDGETKSTGRPQPYACVGAQGAGNSQSFRPRRRQRRLLARRLRGLALRRGHGHRQRREIVEVTEQQTTDILTARWLTKELKCFTAVSDVNLSVKR